jgi:hypothetical protein
VLLTPSRGGASPPLLSLTRGASDMQGGGIVGAPPSLHAALVAAVAAVQAEA